MLAGQAVVPDRRRRRDEALGQRDHSRSSRTAMVGATASDAHGGSFQYAWSRLHLPSGMSGDLPPSTGRMGRPSGYWTGSLRHQLPARPEPMVLGRLLADEGDPAASARRAAPKPSTRRGPKCRPSGLLGPGFVWKPGRKTPHHPPLPRRLVDQHPRWSTTGGDRCAASASTHEWMSLHRGRGPGFHRCSPDRPRDPWAWAPRPMLPQDHLGNAHSSLPKFPGRNGRQRRPMGHRGGPRLDLQVGATVLVSPLNRSTKSSIAITRHHAAAVVIARRGQGVGARRRQGVAGHDQRIVAGELPARPDQRLPDHKGPGPPGGQRAAARPRKTRPAERSKLGNQVVQDRSGPPGRPYVLLNSVGTVPERSRRLTTLLTPSACMETP